MAILICYIFLLPFLMIGWMFKIIFKLKKEKAGAMILDFSYVYELLKNCLTTTPDETERL